MRANPLPLIGGFYADETRPWSQQDICNYLPVAAESDGTRTPTMAKTPPGLSPFARISGEPSRGVYVAEGRLFTVMGNTLYQVTPTDSISLGSISGSSRVRFAHNQITGGNQVLIVNGSAGWVWNTNTSTLTLITDTGYPGAINARFIDGYLIQIEPARRFAFHSDLADALSYNTLDRFTSEVSPDLLVSMAVSNNELILFSERTTEFFENTGAAQQPFRSKRISFNKGCAGRYTVAEMDNTVFWLGDDGSFYLLDGYSPKRISTRPIEQAIRGLNWAQAFAFVWEDSGHAVCYWTFPDGLTFGYDASQQKWHRRASYGFDRWRVQDLAYWQSRWIAGDFQKGRLWELDWAYPWEFDQEFISELTSPVVHDNQSRVLMPRLEVVMDTGMPEVAVRDWEVDQATLSISGNLPDQIVGSAVSFSYTIAGGVPTYVVSLLSGSLPTGLTMNSSGAVTGTASAGGSYSWVVQVVDGDGDTATVADTCQVVDISELYEQVTYTGNGTAARNIATTVDLTGGGLVIFNRSTTGSVGLYSVTGSTNNKIHMNSTSAQTDSTANAFGNGFFTLNGEHDAGSQAQKLNANAVVYTCHVFKKSSRFFDVLTYTGTGASNPVSHGLGVSPGMIMLQKIASTSPSYVTYMKTLGTGKGFGYTDTVAPSTASSRRPFGTAPDASNMTLLAGAFQNGNGDAHVAFLWADDTDSLGLIRNVTWSGTGVAGNAVTAAGWQPQMLMGRADAASNVFRFIGDEFNADFVGNDQQYFPDGTQTTSVDVVGLVTGGFDLKSTTVWNTNAVVHHAIVVRKP